MTVENKSWHTQKLKFFMSYIEVKFFRYLCPKLTLYTDDCSEDQTCNRRN